MPSTRNRLGDQSSPYLLQHADNPVDWRPWGEEAFAEARARDCPVLLSIGYAACHWCHVMAHELFEDEEIAALMNAAFVNIKVDREERPDVDHHYMSALHALGEQGGWPLTMFLAPDGRGFFGGTYWPPTPRWGRPSFRQVIAAISNAWATKRGDLIDNGEAIEAHLAKLAAPRGGGDLGAAELTRAGDGLLRILDPVHGGVGREPKFPNAPIFRFLHGEFFRRADPRFRRATRQLVDALCAGGIYDHLGGGFARYSTDAEWLVPHFEKMLYDNAQILELIALAEAETSSPVYASRTRETFQWLMRELRVGDAFAASLDADQDGEEGLFYVWTADEIDAALGAGAAEFRAVYDVRPDGNWEGRNVLRRLKPLGDEGREGRLAAARAKLFAIRASRAAPPRDDKILADWNGLTIAALARASAVFDATDYLDAARAAFAAVWNNLRDASGRLVHSAREGRVGAPGDARRLRRVGPRRARPVPGDGRARISGSRDRRHAGSAEPVWGGGWRPLSDRRRRRRRALDPRAHRERRRDAFGGGPDGGRLCYAAPPDARAALGGGGRKADPRILRRRRDRAAAKPAAARRRGQVRARRLRVHCRAARRPRLAGAGARRARLPGPRDRDVPL